MTIKLVLLFLLSVLAICCGNDSITTELPSKIQNSEKSYGVIEGTTSIKYYNGQPFDPGWVYRTAPFQPIFVYPILYTSNVISGSSSALPFHISTIDVDPSGNTISDSNGFFSLVLAAGEYSVVAKIDDVYFGIVVTGNIINPITILENTSITSNLEIEYGPVY